MKAINLRINYLRYPLGVDFKEPRLTWNVEGEKYQKAYRIVVSNGTETVFDSGRIESNKMEDILAVPYVSRAHYDVALTVYGEEEGETVHTWFEYGLLKPSDWSAKWIKGNYKVSKKKRYPVDCFKKEFDVKDIASARLYISALGLYEAYLNGKKVGNGFLTPGSTDYDVRVQYDTYDVSKMLKEGKNELIVYLADGWYRGSIGAKGDSYVFGKETKALVQLEISNSTEKKVIVNSDESFPWSNDGEIRFADLKDGEIVDFRKKPGFSGHAIASSYDHLISASNNTHVIEIGRYEPVSIITTKTGKTTYEYLDNVAGFLSVKVTAKEGDKLHFVLGELLDDNNEVSLKNVQCVKKGKKTPLQEITIICKEGLNEYETRFFYGGFRYVTLDSGSKFSNLEVKQVAICSEMEETSSFECSNELVNIFYENTVRSIKSNSVDIPTDCPTRERMGWTGDSQIIFKTASYLFNYGAFATKHIRDVYDRQDKNGRLPQIAPYSAEDWFMDVMNGSVGWADVGVLIPYRMYKQYGDVSILKDNYDNMLRYALFMIERCGPAKGIYSIYARPLKLPKELKRFGVNTGQSYGEWAEPKDVKEFKWTDFACPHPEESMAYTVYIMELMIEISNIIGKTDHVRLFEIYRDGIKKAYQALVDSKKFDLDVDRQAKLVRPLYFCLLNDKQEAFAKERLVKALDNYGWRLGTGFLSTPFILEVLQGINTEYAYRLLENEEMPGWLYMAKNNTGTIWEGWEGPNAQQGISSLNHYSKGAMVEWLFSDMLGINVLPENKFFIYPAVGGHVSYAKGSYRSIYGMISISWKREGDQTNFEIVVPNNTTAEFVFHGHHEIFEPGQHIINLK